MKHLTRFSVRNFSPPPKGEPHRESCLGDDAAAVTSRFGVRSRRIHRYCANAGAWASGSSRGACAYAKPGVG